MGLTNSNIDCKNCLLIYVHNFVPSTMRPTFKEENPEFHGGF